LRYAGLGTQLLVSIGIAVFIGLKADQWLHTLPLFSCVLPLLTSSEWSMVNSEYFLWLVFVD
jgi:hypothetical protein